MSEHVTWSAWSSHARDVHVGGRRLSLHRGGPRGGDPASPPVFGHVVAMERPDAVVQEVDALLADLRAGSQGSSTSQAGAG